MKSMETYLNDNWQNIPNDVKLMIMSQLDEKTIFAFCQSNKNIYNFCKTNNLTADLSYINKKNPKGVLIDNSRKHADLLRRGFETVFSIIMTTELQDNGENRYSDAYRNSNLPDFENLNALELKYGLYTGTEFFESGPCGAKFTRPRLSIRGLPPLQGTIINFVLLVKIDMFEFDMEASVYKNNEDLYGFLFEKYKKENRNSNSEKFIPIWEDFLLNGRANFDSYYAILSELPCP